VHNTSLYPDSETSERTELAPQTGCNVARVNIERLVSTLKKAKAERRMATQNNQDSLFEKVF